MNDAELDRAFAALADTTRRAILARLLEGEASVAELSEPFSITPRAISKHISVLEAAGLVVRSKNAQKRPSHIRAEPLAEIDLWLDRYRVLWNERFDRLEHRIEQQENRKNDK